MATIIWRPSERVGARSIVDRTAGLLWVGVGA
jgi:hypothetical protein